MSPPRADAPGASRGRASAALVAGITVLVHLRSAFGEFLWDDRRFVLDNPAVTAPRSWLAFFTDANTVDTLPVHDIVRPWRTFEFAIDHAISGGDARWFHVHSLLWHVLAAVLLLLVLRRLLPDPRAAVVGALFFALHPGQVESVALVSSRGDVAMGACSLAAILLALKTRGADVHLAASLAAAALACLSKETAVALPLAIAVLRITKLARAPVWPYVAVAALYLVYRAALRADAEVVETPFVLGGSTVGTFATMIRAFGFYLAETLIPAPAFDWLIAPSRSFAEVAVIGWLAVHVALVVSAVRARRALPQWTFAVGCFYAFLLPVSNWPFFLGVPTAERFLYLPLAGAAVAVALGISRAPRAALVPAAVVLAAMATATVARAAMWHDEPTLWSTVLEDHPSVRAHGSLARILRSDALSLRDRSLALPPSPQRTESLEVAKTLLESSLEHAHRGIELECGFEGTLRSTSHATRTLEVIAANDCYVLRRNEEALWHADEAIRIEPESDSYPHYTRALTLGALGFARQGIVAMRHALDLGAETPSAEVASFLLQEGDLCAGNALPHTALEAWRLAERSAPEGPLKREASARIATGRNEEDDRSRLAELDAALAALPRGCPDRAKWTVPH